MEAEWVRRVAGRGFRLVVQPTPGMKNFAGDSSIRTFEQFMESVRRELRRAGARVHFYLVLPRGGEGYERLEADDVTVLREDRVLLPFYYEIGMEGWDMYRWFSALQGVYYADAVVTSRTAAAALLARLLADYRHAREEWRYLRPAVVILEDRVFGRRNTHNLVDWLEFALRSLSYACCRTIFLDEFEFEDAMDVAKLYVSASLLKRIAERSVVMYTGLDTDEIDRLTEGVEKRPRFTLFWGGRLSGQKRVPFVLDVYTRFYEAGHDVDILLTTPHEANQKIRESLEARLKRNRRITVLYGVDRQRYLRLLAASHVFLSGSLYEGFSIGHAEVGYVGVPTIVPRRPWSELLFGRDYKLMYTVGSLEEALAMLEWVYDNYDRALEIARETRERMRRLFDIRVAHRVGVKALLEEYWELVASLVGKGMVGASLGRTLAAAVEVLRGKGFRRASLELILGEAEKMMEKAVRFDVERQFHSIAARWEVYQWLKHELGCVDTCEGPVPIFDLGTCDTGRVEEE